MNDSTTVLIVDDDDLIRDFLKCALQAYGYCVIEATNGKEGLEVYIRERPDVVLTELQMPEMDGTTFIAELSGRQSNTPIVVLSGESSVIKAIDVLRMCVHNHF